MRVYYRLSLFNKIVNFDERFDKPIKYYRAYALSVLFLTSKKLMYLLYYVIPIRVLDYYIRVSSAPI
jgi:hypothetical protein